MKTISILALGAAASMLFAGCYSTPFSYETDSEAWASSIKVDYDTTTGTKELAGPQVRKDDNKAFHLECSLHEDGTSQIRIIVENSTSPAISAVTDDGQNLEILQVPNRITEIDANERRVGSTIITARIGSIIPIDYMRQRADTGFSISFDTTGGDAKVLVSSAYVTGFLSKIDSLRKK